MALTYRPASANDLVQADALVVATINHLTERHGFGSMAAVVVEDDQVPPGNNAR